MKIIKYFLIICLMYFFVALPCQEGGNPLEWNYGDPDSDYTGDMILIEQRISSFASKKTIALFPPVQS